MKRVYIPTMDELYYMQKMGVSIHHYLLSKTIESLVMADVIYKEEDMFDIAYSELPECPEIIYTIAKMYPERIPSSEKAKSDANLCRQLIPTFANRHETLQGFDNMRYFSNETLKDPKVIREIINTLSNKLQSYPRYRFEYLGPNDVLDELFGREISLDTIPNNILDALICIEPSYLIKVSELFQTKKDIEELERAITRGSIRYAGRYSVNAYNHGNSKNNDILTNPNEPTKKLLRVLDRHRQYYNY